MPEDDSSYGTAARDAPVSRADFERAIRALNLSDLDLREAIVQLAARVIALSDELTRRIDGVEPLPAEPHTPAAPPTMTVEGAVDTAIPPLIEQMRVANAGAPSRVSLDLGDDKYATEGVDIPCAELIHLCKARCCRLSFALSTADLDEGIIRWDYGQPYLIRQRASDGYCVHNAPDTHFCTVHHARPRVCRSYDCRNDERVWTDYEQRIPAPHFEGIYDDHLASPKSLDLVERARQRTNAIRREMKAISETYAEREPTKGPRPK